MGIVINWLLKIFSFLDPQEAVQWQHVRGQVCCISEGVCGVSSPKLPNTSSVRQKQRPGATGTTAHSHSVTSFYMQLNNWCLVSSIILPN